MKTFADTNSTLQQEAKHNAKLVRRVELLRQFSGTITSRDSATQIKVAGDASGLFSVSDTLVIPLDNFETNHIITGISYDSGTDATTIICSASTFATDLPGKYIALRQLISGGNVERVTEIGAFRFEAEGETLNSWLAADVDIECENGDGWFANSSETGLFDANAVVWVRVYLGWKNASDRVLYFGGQVDFDSFDDDRLGKTFTFTVYGHLKELERYPAYVVTEPGGDLRLIQGVTVDAITAGTNTVQGLKTIKLDFVSERPRGVEILGVSQDAPSGLVPLRFRYPNYFKFNYGSWTAVSADTDSATLTGADGSMLGIRTSSYDVRDWDYFIRIASDVSKTAEETGRLELSFGDSDALNVRFDFAAALAYDGSSYSDVSDLNDRPAQTFEALDAAGAILYLFSDTPFYSVYCDLDTSDLIGSIQLHYSNGYNSWQAISTFTDGTSDMTASGRISWAAAEVAGWRPLTLDPGGSLNEVRQKYAIKISLSSYTSGSVDFTKISRRQLVTDADGTVVEFTFDLAKVPTDSKEETVALRQISGTWTVCPWYAGVALHGLVEKLLTAANYDSGDYTLDACKLTVDSARLLVAGYTPLAFTRKRITAIFQDSNDVLWIGAENELWQMAEDGEMTKVAEIPVAGDTALPVSIRQLGEYGSTGEIHGLAWWDRYDFPEFPRYRTDPGFDVIQLQVSAAGVFSCEPVGYGADYIMPCEEMMRKGNIYTIAFVNAAAVGHRIWDSSDRAGGENIVIPYPQLQRRLPNGYSDNYYVEAIFSQEGLSSSGSATLNEIAASEFFRIEPQHIAIDYNAIEPDDVGFSLFKFRLGNPGFVVWDSVNRQWGVYQMQRDNVARTDTNVKLGWLSNSAAFTAKLDLSDSLKQPLCGVLNGTDIYYGLMEWNDGSTAISVCKLNLLDTATPGDSTLFDFSSDSANAGASIYGREEYMTILDMAYNATESTIHGVLLDRGNFEYHWFTYFITLGEMYSTQAGSGFTFDKNRQPVNVTTHEGAVYAVVTDRRYRQDGIYLMKAEYSSGSITLTHLGVIDQNRYDHSAMTSGSDGIWGVTDAGLIWKYGTTVYPRVTLADLGDANLREVLNDCCQVLNRQVTARANRNLRIVDRDDYDGSKAVYENIHILKDVKPLSRWEHYYDRVEVSWKDPLTGNSGTEAYGPESWGNRVLKVDNDLIQYRHLAAVLSETLHTYFNQYRNVAENGLIAMIDLEQLDRLQFIMNTANTDISRDDWYRLTLLELDIETMILKIKGIH